MDHPLIGVLCRLCSWLIQTQNAWDYGGWTFFFAHGGCNRLPRFFGILLIPFVYNGVFKTCIITHTIHIFICICIVHIRLRNYLRCSIIPSLLTSAIHGKKLHMAHHANWGRGFRRIGSWAPLRQPRGQSDDMWVVPARRGVLKHSLSMEVSSLEKHL